MQGRRAENRLQIPAKQQEAAFGELIWKFEVAAAGYPGNADALDREGIIRSTCVRGCLGHREV